MINLEQVILTADVRPVTVDEKFPRGDVLVALQSKLTGDRGKSIAALHRINTVEQTFRRLTLFAR